MAAGSLLIQESGGLVSDFDGDGNYLDNGRIVAGTPKVFRQLLQLVSAHKPSRIRQFRKCTSLNANLTILRDGRPTGFQRMNQTETEATGSADALLAVVEQMVHDTRHGGTLHAALDSSLERDLGMDSLARVELVLRVERAST